MFTFQVVDIAIDENRRHGGITHRTEDYDTDNFRHHPLEIPLNYHFQVDVIAHKLLELWEAEEIIRGVLGKRYSSFIYNNITYYIYPEDIQNTSIVEDDIVRSTYRYYIQGWLPTGDTFITVPKLQTLTLNMNNAEHVV
jgi:hypothetical protein